MKITCSCGALIFSDGYLDPDTYIKRFLDMHKPCREAYVKFIKKIDETAYASGFDEVSERLEALEEAEHHAPQKKAIDGEIPLKTLTIPEWGNYFVDSNVKAMLLGGFDSAVDRNTGGDGGVDIDPLEGYLAAVFEAGVIMQKAIEGLK